jgi:hypothetical protein
MPKPTYEELLTTATQYREALCCAMRVIAELDVGTLVGCPSASAQQRFVDECHATGLVDGFGRRNDDVLNRARAKES